MYISATNYIYSFSAENHPIARVNSSEKITIQTLDCSTNRVKDDSDITPIPVTQVNPATGPVWIEGAEPGDILALTITDIRLGSQAHLKLVPELGICQNRVKTPITRVYNINDGFIEFSPAIRIPVNPMVGVIGNAPLGKPIPTAFGGLHGGNLDNKLITKGATIYLPVFCKGALLAIGDLHASMGEGELCGLAMETSGEVDLNIRLIKGKNIPSIIGENAEVIFACGYYGTLEEAVQKISSNFADVLKSILGLSLEDSVLLISAAANFHFCQCAPNAGGVSARLELARDIIGFEHKGLL
jgi:amidase